MGTMEERLRELVRLSFGSAPEDMLKEALDTCIELSGASGGSILGEEGRFLQILFANVPEVIGVRVPIDSIAGATVTDNLVVYTFAPQDKRHFTGVDDRIRQVTNYLLSIPIPSIHQTGGQAREPRNAGALQLLFDENIYPDMDLSGGPKEFAVDDFKDNELYVRHLQEIFCFLPIVAFSMEVMRLQQTSYQAVHELKNKLIAGLSWINCLRDDINDESPDVLEQESIREDFDLSVSSIREGVELSKTYLQLARLYSAEFEPVQLNDILEAAAASAKALGQKAGAEGLRVALDLDPASVSRDADAGQLTMAFFNLCKNAIEALVESKVEPPVLTISSVADGPGTLVRISDNGPGMPTDISDALFVPFKTKKEGGTGLGLTITKRIVDIHGGVITCHTGKEGTSFEITL